MYTSCRAARSGREQARKSATWKEGSVRGERATSASVWGESLWRETVYAQTQHKGQPPVGQEERLAYRQPVEALSGCRRQAAGGISDLLCLNCVR